MADMEKPHVTEYILLLIAVLSVFAIILAYDITGNVVGIFVKIIPGIRTSDISCPNTIVQNMTIVYNFTAISGYLYCEFNRTLEINVTIPNKDTVVFVNLSVTANMTRDIFTIDNGIVISPATAKISNVTFNSTDNITKFFLREANLNFSGIQEVFLFFNDNKKRINLTIGNESRKLAILDQFFISPLSADIVTTNFSQNALRTRLSGNGTQEVIIYIGNQPEPISIVIDGSITLTKGAWVFNSTEKTIRFNMTFSERDVVVNFPAITTTTTTIAPSAAPSPSGGGGGFISIENFTIEEDLITASLVQGQEDSKYITIKNTGNKRLNILIDSDMEKFLFISESSIYLSAGETKKLKINIFSFRGEKPGIYTGKIVLSSGAIKRHVNVVIEVKEREALFDISVSVLPEYKLVEPGKKILALIKIENIGLRGDLIDVELHTKISDFEKNVIYESKKETLYVGAELEVIREIAIPENLQPGDYVVTATMNFRNTSVSSFDVFTVGKPSIVAERIDTTFYTIISITAFIMLAAILLVLYEHTKVIGFIHMHYHGGHERVPRLPKGELKKQQDKLVHRLGVLKQSYREGVMGKDEYVKKLKDTEQKIKQVHAKLKKLEEESIEYSEEELAIFREKKQEYEKELKGLKKAYDQGAINKDEYAKTKETLIKKIKKIKEQLNQ